ncbi:MAG: DUF4859 domain-containing protein [Muribaculaceae bacterium]|nr:DUF4859 domain-containing protein [Muribaculaceae bacterium]
MTHVKDLKMKTTSKYNKWLFGAGLFLAVTTITSCDKEEIYVDPIPETFNVPLTTLNVEWNETEGVVDVAANDDWKAESKNSWISIDPSKGEAGDTRVYLLFESNPYRLPRTGEIVVNCGGESKTVQITQAGCSDDALIAPIDLYLEVPSLDWEAGEISLSAYSEEIMGNLGMTMEEFTEGIGDEGNLEFFVLDKDNNWIAGGTSGTRCGAWFDNNMEVTQWSTGSYPANAAFMEVYNEDGPTIVIGRAPANPDNAEYTIRFGFTPANDHSRYQYFTLNFVFTPVDLKGTVVATHDIDMEIVANEGYVATPAVFDAAAICGELGCASLDLAKVVGYDADGEFVGYSANNGYWYMQNGSIGSWGDGAGWFIEYWGEGPDSEDYSSFAVGPFPGVVNVAATSQIGFWYNNNVVMFNINVKVVEGEAVEE